MISVDESFYIWCFSYCGSSLFFCDVFLLFCFFLFSFWLQWISCGNGTFLFNISCSFEVYTYSFLAPGVQNSNGLASLPHLPLRCIVTYQDHQNGHSLFQCAYTKIPVGDTKREHSLSLFPTHTHTHTHTHTNSLSSSKGQLLPGSASLLYNCATIMHFVPLCLFIFNFNNFKTKELNQALWNWVRLIQCCICCFVRMRAMECNK